jgi:hypothetical protein
MPKKSKTLTKLKKELDTIFSVYIRLRGNRNGVNMCITCGKMDNWKNLQCGHFQSRRFLPTRYHEDNCFPQCVSCNIFRQGEQFIFGLALEKIVGEGTAENMIVLARTKVKYMRHEYEEKIKHYKEEVKKLTSQLPDV